MTGERGERAAREDEAPQHARRRGQLRRLGDLMLIAGGLMLAYPLWSAGYAQIQQARLNSAYQTAAPQYDQVGLRVGLSPSPDASAIPEGELIRRLAVDYGQGIRKGDAIGRLRIPRISLSRLVQEGEKGSRALDPDSDRALLRKGPVHYAVTPLPGAGEPFAVAGHRTTYGAPFYRLDKLRAGDAIVVETPYASFRYAVAKKTVVKPGDVSVLLDRGYGIVLTTCTPPYSSSHRLVVWGSLESARAKSASATGSR